MVNIMTDPNLAITATLDTPRAYTVADLRLAMRYHAGLLYGVVGGAFVALTKTDINRALSGMQPGDAAPFVYGEWTGDLCPKNADRWNYTGRRGLLPADGQIPADFRPVFFRCAESGMDGGGPFVHPLAFSGATDNAAKPTSANARATAKKPRPAVAASKKTTAAKKPAAK